MEATKRNKLDELLSKFKDGELRYHNDVMFNKCISMLLNGADPISILDSVLLSCKEQQDTLVELVRNQKVQYIIKPEDISQEVLSQLLIKTKEHGR